jgi:hypothetical protein
MLVGINISTVACEGWCGKLANEAATHLTAVIQLLHCNKNGADKVTITGQ